MSMTNDEIRSQWVVGTSKVGNWSPGLPVSYLHRSPVGTQKWHARKRAPIQKWEVAAGVTGKILMKTTSGYRYFTGK